jgi:hypothetical protein
MPSGDGLKNQKCDLEIGTASCFYYKPGGRVVLNSGIEIITTLADYYIIYKHYINVFIQV